MHAKLGQHPAQTQHGQTHHIEEVAVQLFHQQGPLALHTVASGLNEYPNMEYILSVFLL